MPLPLILGGAALLMGGYAIKKGLDAKDNFDRASRKNREAREIVNDAKEDLEIERRKAQESLERCAKIGEKICKTTLLDYQKHLQKLNRSVTKPKSIRNLSIGSTNFKTFNIQQASTKIGDIAAGSISALGTGAMAGFATFGTVSALGTASTGTAIASLSGAAATNATLAWLGGGSLAAGGMGVAAGTAILGGIVAAPVLLVGGLLMSNRAEAELEKAETNYQKALVLAEEIEMATSKTRAIRDLVELKIEVMTRLDKVFQKSMPRILSIHPKKMGFFARIFAKIFSISPYSEAENKILERADILYMVASSVVVGEGPQTALLTESGCANQQAKEKLIETQTMIKKVFGE